MEDLFSDHCGKAWQSSLHHGTPKTEWSSNRKALGQDTAPMGTTPVIYLSNQPPPSTVPPPPNSLFKFSPSFDFEPLLLSLE
jgi:hypothetical protein